MDLISRVLDGVTVRSPLLAELRVQGDKSIDMLEGAGAPFHYIVSGSFGLLQSGSATTLNAGDLALLPSWTRYILHFGAGGRTQTVVELVEERKLPMWSRDAGLDAPLLLEIGRPPYDTVVLSGNFVFDTEEAAFLISSLPSLVVVNAAVGALRNLLSTTFDLVLQEMEVSRPGFAAVSARALELLFVQVLREWLLEAEHPPGWARGISQGNVRRALQAMYAHPGHPWTLRDLAQKAGQSRSAFAQTFRETMGESPFVHLRRLRVHLATARLKTGRQSVAAIGSDLGYASGYSFSRAFRSEAGMTASEYRRSKKSSGQADPP